MTSHDCHNFSDHQQLDCFLSSNLTADLAGLFGLTSMKVYIRVVHWWLSDSSHKGPVMWKAYSCHDININLYSSYHFGILDSCKLFLTATWWLGARLQCSIVNTLEIVQACTMLLNWSLELFLWDVMKCFPGNNCYWLCEWKVSLHNFLGINMT